MTRREIHGRLADNWVNIILTVVSIIQGLAFNNLVPKLPDILGYTRDTLNFCLLAHFILSFVLILRVFQTYVTAALEYDDWMPSFRDAFLIFIIGAFEYLLFSTLNVDHFIPSQFYIMLIMITVIALAGYINAAIMIKGKQPRKRRYEREIHLQSVNIVCLIEVFAYSLILAFLSPAATNIIAVFALIITAILAFNIYYSLRVTFEINEMKIT